MLELVERVARVAAAFLRGAGSTLLGVLVLPDRADYCGLQARCLLQLILHFLGAQREHFAGFHGPVLVALIRSLKVQAILRRTSLAQSFLGHSVRSKGSSFVVKLGREVLRKVERVIWGTLGLGGLSLTPLLYVLHL